MKKRGQFRITFQHEIGSGCSLRGDGLALQWLWFHGPLLLLLDESVGFANSVLHSLFQDFGCVHFDCFHTPNYCSLHLHNSSHYSAESTEWIAQYTNNTTPRPGPKFCYHDDRVLVNNKNGNSVLNESKLSSTQGGSINITKTSGTRQIALNSCVSPDNLRYSLILVLPTTL